MFFSSSYILFALRHVSEGFTVCKNLVVHVGLFLRSAWLTFSFIYQYSSCMLDKHPSIMVCMHQFQNFSWNEPDNNDR